MAHLKKYAVATLGHMTCHYERAVDDEGKYLKFGNQDIDPVKTHLNYNLGPEREQGQIAFIQQRRSEVRCLKRDDVKVMCSWIVTAPQEVAGGPHEKEFFKQAYDFMAKRYGADNVISAYVHMDETTPHMHFAFVPVTKDKKRGDLKISAKEVVTKIELKGFHYALDTHLRESMQERYPGGIVNGATIDGNKSIKQLKAETVKTAQEQAADIVETAKKKAKTLNDRMIPIDAAYKAKKAFIDQSVKGSDVSMMYPEYAKVKGIGKKKYVTVPQDKWEQKHVAADQISAIRKARETLSKEIERFRGTDVAKEVGLLRRMVKNRDHEIEKLKDEILDLKQDVQDELARVENIYDVIRSDPELAERYNQQIEVWKNTQEQVRAQHRTPDRGGR